MNYLALKGFGYILAGFFIGCGIKHFFFEPVKEPCPTRPVIKQTVIKRYNLPSREVWLRWQYMRQCDDNDNDANHLKRCGWLLNAITKEVKQ